MLVSGCATSHSRGAAWDYKVVQGYVPSEIEKQLKQLGDEGWAVVSSTSPTESSGKVLIILKRQK
jgi:hypothetical protein